ncbi:HlyD family efflux transporter periplasmic adaptor subunit [Thalassotalea litorea]|uniref:HlyD family efflux transporter periplasmic adaptor subunit n=1 Tax=Thalassotalea litorea TaxID=2020715 RepID=A0A5R9IPL1_9GAMM|nr:HlyD family efflux transporter periplasmic adaptor subunit [Thalassotalea litorea]TLU67475.1 HlyD family efflux transporter periplasmic adaptor subunit [Thalassotalea litorea]
MGLFRKEVLEKQQHRLQGTVVLTQPLSLSLLVTAIVIMFFLIISFLALASYSRKETVRGYLKPDKGVIKTYGQLTGYVDELYVEEGDTVAQGQPLLTLSTRGQFGFGQSTETANTDDQLALSERLINRLSSQIHLLNLEAEQYQSLQKKELQSLEKRNSVLRVEQQVTKQQAALLENKFSILAHRHQQIESLFNQGFVSDREKQSHHQQLLDLKQERQGLKRIQLQQQRELTRMELELDTIPEQYQLKISALNRHQAELENQLGQIRTNNKYTVRANRDGIVTGLQVVAGESVSPNTLLLSLIPEHSVLLAELYLPTRSAGFITSGQATKLRFDAFPYQRFGFINGKIIQVDQTIIKPAELSAPFSIREPVYRIRAQLDSQGMQTNDSQFPLRSGMLFQADIILEKRSLMAWLFEPLLGAAEKL